MRLPKFTLFRPGSVEEGCTLLSEYKEEVRIVAGGSAILIDFLQRLTTPKYVISLKGLSGLDYIKYDERQGLKIGALTTIDQVNTSPLIREKYPILSQASGEVGVPAVRYMGTVGGNLCLDTRCIYYNQSEFWRSVRPSCFKRAGHTCHAVKGGDQCYAVCQADLAPVLVALEAKVRIQRRGSERVIPVSEFFTDDGETPNVLQFDEIVTEIQVPPPLKNSAGSYQKLKIREAIDFPLGSVATVLAMDGSRVCRKAKLVLGAVASAPVEVNKAETVLEGKKINDSVLEAAADEIFKAAHPVANLSIDNTYRRKMTRILFQRAVKQALGQ